MLITYGIINNIENKMKEENVWQKAAQNFIWDKPYKKISQTSKTGPKKWFVAGKLNYTKTIFEKNFALGNASREAVVFYKSPFQKESYTYSSLLDEVNALACYLEQKGINKKSRVLILTDSKKEQVFLVLSLLRLGIQFGVLYSRSPLAIINSLILKSRATHIISNTKLAKIISSKKIILIKIDSKINKKAVLKNKIVPRLVFSSFPSFLCFSSGTTGEIPKIFLNGNAGFFVGAHHIFETNFFHDLKNNFILAMLDFAFGNSMMPSLITPLIKGGKVVFFDFSYRLNDKSIIKILEKEGVESTVSSPPFFEIPQTKNKTNKIISIIIGGQKISESVLDFIKNTFLGTRLVNTLGSIESFAYLKCLSDKNSKSIKILKPLPELEYKIINKEIFIKNTWPCLVLPLSNKQSYLRRWQGNFFGTGDLARKTKLGLEIISRKDKLIKHKGQMINLEYLEKILESEPFVQKAKCLIVCNKSKSKIAVFLSLKQEYKNFSRSLLENSIKKIVDVKFGSYAKPGKIVFVKEFPTSAGGKIMEKILLKKYA